MLVSPPVGILNHSHIFIVYLSTDMSELDSRHQGKARPQPRLRPGAAHQEAEGGRGGGVHQTLQHQEVTVAS